MGKTVFLCLMACATSASAVISQQGRDAHFPIKIGVLADSQITSNNGRFNYSQRSKAADRMVSVAIRPPAMECFLAGEMLRVALTKLTGDTSGEKKGVDVILFLGDGANSGGTDELKKFFSILETHRASTGVPIFVVVGNHDYLGCGNITDPGKRYALLNRLGQPSNPPLSKYEVLTMISRFNHTSVNLPTNKFFTYSDNYDYVEAHKTLDHTHGLYLGGTLSYARPGGASVQIFLLDTSDYINAPNWSGIAEWGLYGLIGSLSFEDSPERLSQAGYFRKIAEASAPDFRFMASHYPKDHLDRITFSKPGDVPTGITKVAWQVSESVFSFPEYSKTLNSHLEKLLSPKGRNYWLSGHTHVPRMPKPAKLSVGGLFGEKYFSGLNVGSTTDNKSHVAIVESYKQNENQRIDDCVGYRQIPLFQYNQDLLTLVFNEIAKYGQDHLDDPNFRGIVMPMDDWVKKEKSPDIADTTVSTLTLKSGNVLDQGLSIFGFKDKDAVPVEQAYRITMGATILGLNKQYQRSDWQYEQTAASSRNLHEFVSGLIEHTRYSRDDVLSCLAFISGAYECGNLDAKCGFGPTYLKKICGADGGN